MIIIGGNDDSKPYNIFTFFHYEELYLTQQPFENLPVRKLSAFEWISKIQM